MGGSSTIDVRRLVVADVEAYRAIRLAAMRVAGDSFGSTYAVEAARPLQAHAERLASSAVFGAYCDDALVGMAGLRRHDGPREMHKGFLWGFYVEPPSRRRGVATCLMSAVLDAARGLVEQVTLTVVEDNAAAIALYERFGFQRYGLEPNALKRAGGYANEVLMVAFLGRPSEPAQGLE